MVAQSEVLLIPKLRRQIAEFLQHSSLKRLGMLYQSTCVGFGYDLMEGYFQEPPRGQTNPIRSDNSRDPSLPPGPGILTWFPFAGRCDALREEGDDVRVFTAHATRSHALVRALPHRLGPANPCPTAVHMEPFSTSAFKVV